MKEERFLAVIANGNSCYHTVQAARRICVKRGIPCHMMICVEIQEACGQYFVAGKSFPSFEEAQAFIETSKVFYRKEETIS